jgi:hypothetical protein
MKAQELRIGNYLKKDVVVKIDARSIFDIWEETKEYQPILLTEEWLLRLGFELLYSNLPNQYMYGKDLIRAMCDKRKGFNEIFVIDTPHIKYVHQLQNLHFALTGEELIYDEWIIEQ